MATATLNARQHRASVAYNQQRNRMKAKLAAAISAAKSPCFPCKSGAIATTVTNSQPEGPKAYQNGQDFRLTAPLQTSLRGVSGRQTHQEFHLQNIKRPPVRGGVDLSRLASPFFVSPYAEQGHSAADCSRPTDQVWQWGGRFRRLGEVKSIRLSFAAKLRKATMIESTRRDAPGNEFRGSHRFGTRLALSALGKVR
ncbi:hypothetical protein Pla52o_47720 [Novipirellula galeiformis]|uniref:Uncharacterized protein n=1 Tax=Novipirellula galeiformis TaxID=2528004 RepID=A0A5C6CA53_9BACT|nr:hypothetical protein Pla52o_47720 [Novipirellula galeiformis]